MRTFIFILLVILVFLLLVAYSLLVIAHDADERAERMYRKWRKEIDERSNSEDG